MFALQFLLLCHGKAVTDLEALEAELGTEEEAGTSHEALLNFLKEEEVHYTYEASLEQLSGHLPAMVNYQYGDDGHYGVVLSITKDAVLLYNPYPGELELLNKAEFYESWYSKRYGNRWFLSLK